MGNLVNSPSVKPPYVYYKLLSQVEKVRASDKINVSIKTWSRSSVILPHFVGITFEVYNGKKFIPVLIKEEMINYKLGDFSPTRTYRGHAGNNKVKKK